MKAFLAVALVHFLAVASPGPDFAIIVKQSITQSRAITLWTAFGVALGILVHVAYSLLGIGFIISRSILLFSVLKLIGAGYLLYIGGRALTARPTHTASAVHDGQDAMSPAAAIRVGFLCNALNPKATLFFLALFTQIISPFTPLFVQLWYGLYMSAATFAWFAFLGSVFSLQLIRRHVDVFHLWAERVMGIVLIALGLKVAAASRS